MDRPETFPAEPTIPDANVPRDNWYSVGLVSAYKSFVAVPRGTHKCDVVVEEPTFFVNRYYPKNMFHALLTMYVRYEFGTIVRAHCGVTRQDQSSLPPPLHV
jgi:hypothetical protein